MRDLDELLKICARYIGKDYHLGDAIPGDKLRNAQANFPIPLTERVAALVDTTVWKSCKTGLAIAEGGIYWKNDRFTGTVRTHMTWEQLATSSVRRMGRYDIEIGTGNVIGMAGSEFNKDTAVKLLQDLAQWTPAPETLKPDWMIAVGGKQSGPFTAAEIGEQLQRGVLDPGRCFVWRSGMASWLAIAKVPALSAIMEGCPAGATPPPPPPPDAP